MLDKSIKKNNNNVVKRIIGLSKKNNTWQYDLDEFDLTTFEIKDDKLFMTDEDGDSFFIEDFDERTQLSILYNIARLLNIDIKTNEFKPDK